MMMLLVLKERLKSFYGKNAVLVGGIIKFIYGFSAIYLLNANIGLMAALKSAFVPPVCALVCAFLPYSAISFLVGVIMICHIYSVSMEIALVTAVFLIIVMLLYYGFQPGDSYWLVLTPMALLLHVPYMIPLLAGLSGSLVTAVPTACGVVVYYILSYVKQNAGVLTNDASVDITQKFVQIIRSLVTNDAMLVMLIACLAGILIVYLIRTRSIDYAWYLAIVIGTTVQLAVVFAGAFMFDISFPIVEQVIGVVVSLAIALLYLFFVFAVDYTRTEYTQFEDDDYVYYVKAVPKIVVSKPDVKVQRINNPGKTRRGAKDKEQPGSR